MIAGFWLRRISNRKLRFSRLLGLSRNQEQQLAGNMRLRGVVSDDRPDWEGLSERRIQLRSIDGRATAQFPSFGVLFNEMELIGVRGISLASSAGCAVWRDLGGARERALLELVERDAVAQAWYNRLGITSLNRAFLREILPAPLFFILGRSATALEPLPGVYRSRCICSHGFVP
ncbi:YcaO-like family protein [Roseibium salinum]|nr:YcaO-like family protein [Roseibium salinum]